MPSHQDLLVEFPPVFHKNLIILVKELPYTFLILPQYQNKPSIRILETAQEYISNTILRDAASPTILPSAEAAALAERFHEVSFRR